jgi:M6 family metalloprotease-like protein
MMKKTIRTISILILLCPFLFGIHASSEEIQFQQPDGDIFYGHIMGDERQSWHETKGWSIVKNQAGWWTYAKAIDDTKLIPSNEKVSLSQNPEDNPNLAHIPKPLIPEAIIFNDESPIPSLSNTRSDTFFVPCLLIDFSDYDYSFDRSALDDVWNLEGYSHPGKNHSGSFRDFYQEISYEQFLPISTLSNWITSSNTHNYFAHSNPNGYDHLKEMIRTAVDALEAEGFDWSKFDNDGDGNVDALNVIHAGPGAEEGDESNIWSHKWNLGNWAVQYDGVTINAYTVNPEKQNGNIVAIGVLAHEFGHALGLPDLYDTDYSSSGSGKLALMGSGSWGTSGNTPWYPSAMNAWSKSELGWTNIETLTDDINQVTLGKSFDHNLIYQVNHPSDNSEYWLIENRQKVGTDTLMPSPGLAIWHIDTEMTASGWAPNNNEPHYGVALEQADGLYSLENGGYSDGGDVFPGTTNNREFSHTTIPSTESYYGLPSMVRIDNISDSGDNMSFDIQFNEIITASAYPISGSGNAYDEGSFQIGFDNDVDIQSLSISIDFFPAPVSITDITVLNRLSVDSIVIDGFNLQFVNPILSAGTGPVLEIGLFANTGSAFQLEIQLDHVLATRQGDDAEIGMIHNQSATYTISPQEQVYAIENASGAAGGSASYAISLDNNVPIRMMIFHMSDIPHLLTPSDEPFTDENGDGIWNEGESFEDWNHDDTWNPMLEKSDRLSNWNIDLIPDETGVKIIASSWEDSLLVGSGPLFTLNNLVDASASSGQTIDLHLEGELMMDYSGNTNMSFSNATSSFTLTEALSVNSELGLNHFKLYANYPNPFNPITSIRFDVGLDIASPTSLNIYDISGKLVETLLNKTLQAGAYEVRWNAQNFASGIYFSELISGDKRQTKKIILLK